MRVTVILFLLVISTLKVFCQKNYIIPEPHKITFLDNSKTGFRLSKKTSIQFDGVNNSQTFIKDFISFVNNETGFELRSKINKKSNILFIVKENSLSLGDEGYRILIQTQFHYLQMK